MLNLLDKWSPCTGLKCVDVGMHADLRHVAHLRRAAAAAAPQIRAPPAPTHPLAAMTVRVGFLVRQAHCEFGRAVDADVFGTVAAIILAGQRGEPLPVCVQVDHLLWPISRGGGRMAQEKVFAIPRHHAAANIERVQLHISLIENVL